MNKRSTVTYYNRLNDPKFRRQVGSLLSHLCKGVQSKRQKMGTLEWAGIINSVEMMKEMDVPGSKKRN